MIVQNMFKIAWRNAIRQKLFTFLNILGLTIGIVACLYIGLYVYSEMTYDTFHANGDRIYRINQPNIWSDWDKQMSSTGPNVATALRENAPEFEQITRILSVLISPILNYQYHFSLLAVKEETWCYRILHSWVLCLKIDVVVGRIYPSMQNGNILWGLTKDSSHHLQLPPHSISYTWRLYQ